MRTTIDLPDTLLHQAKQLALDADRTLSEVIADALLHELSRRNDPQRGRKLTELPIFRGGRGLRTGVDSSSNAAMQGLADEIALRESGIDGLR